MSRYIDADALTSHIRHFFFELINKAEPIMTDDGEAFDLKIVNPLLEANKAIASIIREQPTADVVEVVRCEDCKHSSYFVDAHTDNYGTSVKAKVYCRIWQDWVSANGYCFLADKRERREDDKGTSERNS